MNLFTRRGRSTWTVEKGSSGINSPAMPKSTTNLLAKTPICQWFKSHQDTLTSYNPSNSLNKTKVTNNNPQSRKKLKSIPSCRVKLSLIRLGIFKVLRLVTSGLKVLIIQPLKLATRKRVNVRRIGTRNVRSQSVHSLNRPRPLPITSKTKKSRTQLKGRKQTINSHSRLNSYVKILK